MKVRSSDLLVSIAVPFDREIDNINERARNTMIGIGLMALAMVAGVGYWAINNTFRPLRDIEKTASRIAAGDLSQRVPVYPRNTELGRSEERRVGRACGGRRARRRRPGG